MFNLGDRVVVSDHSTLNNKSLVGRSGEVLAGPDYNLLKNGPAYQIGFINGSAFWVCEYLLEPAETVAPDVVVQV